LIEVIFHDQLPLQLFQFQVGQEWENMLEADLNSSLTAAALLRSTGMAVLMPNLEVLEILEGDSYHRLLMQKQGSFGRCAPRRLSRLVYKHGVFSETRDMLNKKGGQSAFYIIINYMRIL
jgi:hypothetical protein